MLDFFYFGCINFFSSFFCSLHSFGVSGAAICFTKAKNVVLLCVLSTSFYVRYILDKSQVKVSSSRRSDAWCLFHMFWTVLLAGCVLKRSFEKEISPPRTSGNVDGQLDFKALWSFSTAKIQHTFKAKAAISKCSWHSSGHLKWRESGFKKPNKWPYTPQGAPASV